MIASLRDAPFLATADAASRDALLAAAEDKTYASGEMVFRQGDPPDHVFFVRSGAVRIYVEQPDGHRIELRTLRPGEILGELSVVGEGHRTASAQAATDLELWSIDRETFNRVYRSDQKLAVEIAKIMAPYVLADEATADMTVADLRARIARSIVEISEEGTTITVPDLARMTGARVSNVISVLEHFEAGGAVGIGSNGIEVLDEGELEALIDA